MNAVEVLVLTFSAARSRNACWRDQGKAHWRATRRGQDCAASCSEPKRCQRLASRSQGWLGNHTCQVSRIFFSSNCWLHRLAPERFPFQSLILHYCLGRSSARPRCQSTSFFSRGKRRSSLFLIKIHCHCGGSRRLKASPAKTNAAFFHLRPPRLHLLLPASQVL